MGPSGRWDEMAKRKSYPGNIERRGKAFLWGGFRNDDPLITFVGKYPARGGVVQSNTSVLDRHSGQHEYRSQGGVHDVFPFGARGPLRGLVRYSSPFQKEGSECRRHVGDRVCWLVS